MSFRIALWLVTAFFGLISVSQLGAHIFENRIQDHTKVTNEQYDPRMSELDNIDKLVQYIDSITELKELGPHRAQEHVLLIDDVLRMRFYHGVSYISFADNALANLAGNLLWEDFKAGVTSEEILKHHHALCSQSAIVFQEISRRYGYDVRAIGLKNHFCSEVLYDGSWHLIDSDFEPIFDISKPIPCVNDLADNPELTRDAYKNVQDKRFLNSLDLQFVHVKKYNVNEFPAMKMRIFQLSTFYAGRYLWIPLLFVSLLVEKRHRSGAMSKVIA